ncbi:protein kinase [Nesterenkonia sp. MY13]|uniref:non-specific serine/threonine protein kinase n=1 Tax=Nesterenkonia sedimenti TaxID=1463632 RepID=A0A7X8TLL6_9MICC|nr:PASTA domain-containing protein [Nesterenkonia sedimenti]NLS10799.1 protein kinase [Nesterenkonia sedimenti]
MTEDRVLNGRYRIEALIGRGGMADVYRAQDLSLQRTVAVKMLRPDLARDPMFQTRFKREAQSSASLNHPNIVGVYDTGSAEVDENGQTQVKTPFIVMEYVDGVTLRHILHGTPSQESAPPEPGEDATAQADPVSGEHTRPMDSDILGVADEDATQAVPHVNEPLQEKIDTALGRPLTEQDAAGYMSGVLAALSYSHDRGIVHRDIKPSNVMISNAGDVKVMDFGIARALADSAQTMTQTSAVVGTAQYLSPEQARGELVDHRSDLYSAGCVLFELLTNRPPFTGDSPVSVAYQHVREEPPRVSDFNREVSPAMESVVAKALTKDPALRFQTAEEFDTALYHALQGIPVEDAAATAAMAAVGGGGAGFDDLVHGAAPGQLSARTPEDAEYEEYREERPARRNRTGLYVLVVILALVLVGLLIFLFSQIFGGDDGDDGDDTAVEAEEMVTISDVSGMPQAEAEAALREVGLEPNVEAQEDDEVEPGHAIGTDPAAGEEIESGSEVTLFISEGPDETLVPENLVGMSLDEATAAIEDAGLSVGTVSEEDHESAPADEVTASSPEPGAELQPGDEVSLTVSTGEVELPGAIDNYVGQWRNMGEEYLVSEGFELAPEPLWVETENIESSGELIGYEVNGESVSGGDRIPNDAVIQIVAGYLPEEEEEDEDYEDSDEEDEDNGDSDEEEDEEDEDSGNGNNGNGNGNGNGNNGNGNGNGNGNNGNGNGNNDDAEDEE